MSIFESIWQKFHSSCMQTADFLSKSNAARNRSVQYLEHSVEFTICYVSIDSLQVLYKSILTSYVNGGTSSSSVSSCGDLLRSLCRIIFILGHLFEAASTVSSSDLEPSVDCHKYAFIALCLHRCFNDPSNLQTMSNALLQLEDFQLKFGAMNRDQFLKSFF